MGAINFRSGYEFDPRTYAGQYAGGLLGRLQAAMSLGETGTGAGSGRMDEAPFDPEAYSDQQGGLLGRLRALQAQQHRYQPVPVPNDAVFPSPHDPDFRELTRLPDNVTSQTNDSPPAPQSVPLSDADQARQAREVAAARMARGARSSVRVEGPPPDPVDIAKSAGIGLANGAVNTTGLLLGDIPTGFGYLPNNFLPNLFRSLGGRPQLAQDEPDYFKSWRPDELRRWIETGHTGEFYQPKTRTGRYAETIAEFVPAILAGAGMGAAWAGATRGVPAAAAAFRELPGTIMKHAIAPGIAVQGLQDAHPESEAGTVLQKGYPVARRVLPVALAAKRHFGL